MDKGSDDHGNPGIRPIGIGECLRRIVGKSVMTVLKQDIQSAGGCLQTCTGLKSGIEAAIHAANSAWNKDSTECLLQVDADNAFNRLNRKVALHNIRELCPPLFTYLHNHYQDSAHLFINDKYGQEMLLSEEGSTQGDPSAMGFYALGIRPLIDALQEFCKVVEECLQEWFADDASALGKLLQVRKWWDKLNELGPKFGYFPKTSKSFLILKSPTLLDRAREIFAGTNIQITCQGQRHLGAVIGHENYQQQYVSSKVDKWVEDVAALAKIALDEPQFALAAYTRVFAIDGYLCSVQSAASATSFSLWRTASGNSLFPQ